MRGAPPIRLKARGGAGLAQLPIDRLMFHLARRPRKAAAARGADACAGARVRAPAVRYRLIGL
ncbi:hypothetical protein [Burkholderia pseudomallei]|uniref:hypothetical protein n=1 Tax=Burkholderia pseudomallei TaxID=28450 RepID=UPI000AB81BCC|nr:hypothetical protein [Burkholderia pseudomallei]